MEAAPYSPGFAIAAPPARRLTAADRPWAGALLSTALADHPALGYVAGSGEGAAARRAWLLSGLLRVGLRFGAVYANPEGTALAVWLPGTAALTPGRLLRAGLLPAAPWRLSLTGLARLRQWLAATGWLRQHSAPQPHQWLLALAVRPDAQGRGAGRRLLLATLAARQGAGSCYVDTQLVAQLPFFQRLGFQLVGYCPLGGPLAGLTNWGLRRAATPA